MTQPVWKPIGKIVMADGLEIESSTSGLKIGHGPLAFHAWPYDDVAYAIAQLKEVQPPVALDFPDGEGYFFFEGRIERSDVPRLRWLVMVRRNSIDKQLYAYRFGGQVFNAKMMFGSWYKVILPWETNE